MDPKKSNVVKSKSSNSAIPTKNERATGKNKKTNSNVEVQQTVIKKRGVYVEKKPYKMGRLSPGQSAKKLVSPRPTTTRFDSPNRSPTASPPPRRDRKKFLNSVLNILSQNTTSTQYPEKNEKPNRKTTRDVVKKTSIQTTHRRLSSPIPMAPGQKAETKKPKYKSRTLNNNPNEIDQFVVWKKSTMKTSPDGSVSSKTSMRIQCDDETDSNSPIRKQIAEGKQIRSSRMLQRMDLEPDTLVSQNKTKEDKSGIYDFFVDLLETTLNVYNVNTAEVNVTKSKESNLKLEIDEHVAEKLNDIANNLKTKRSKIFRIADDLSTETKTFMNSVMNNSEKSEKIDLAEDYNIRIRQSRSPTSFRSYMKPRSSISPTSTYMSFKSQATRSRASKSPGRSTYSQSFSYSDRYNTSFLKSQSAVMPHSSKKRHKKRKTLLGMLKEELSFNDYVYDEPQNLFEALKIMARNKRRSKTIQFADNVKQDDDFKGTDCMKRKKLIPASLRSKKSKRNNDSNQSYETNRYNRSSYYKPKSESEYLGDTESYRSLEVYDEVYDYDTGVRSPSPVRLPPKKVKKRQMKKITPPVLPSESTVSTEVGYVGENDDNEGTMLNFAETIMNTIDYRTSNNDNMTNMPYIMN